VNAVTSALHSEDHRATLRYAVLLLLVSAVVRSPTLWMHNFNVDEAIYSSMATQMLDGALYFRDVVDHKPPGIYYIYTAVFALFGPYNLTAIHFVLFVTVALTGLLICFIGRRLFHAVPPARVAGLLYVVVGATGPPMDFQAANAELFMNLPTVAALLLYLWARTPGRTRGASLGYFGAGLLLSCAALIKFQAGFVVLAIAAHLLWSGGPRVLPLLLGLAGLLTPFGGHALLYHAVGAWDAMWWGLTFNSRYVGASPLGFQLLRALLRSLIFLGLAFPLLLPAVAFGVRRRVERLPWLFLVTWLLAAAAAVSIGGRYFLHYYVQLGPPLALMGAHRLLRWGEGRRWLLRLAAGVVALNALVWITVAALDGRLRPHEQWHFDRYAAVGRYVQQHTPASARIFVWGDSPNIYLWSRRRMGTRYLWVNYQVGRVWGTPYDEVDAPDPPSHLIAHETWRPLLQDLERNRPELIIDAAAGKLDEFDRLPLSRFPRVAAIVAAHYTLEARVMGVPIYRARRGGAPLGCGAERATCDRARGRP